MGPAKIFSLLANFTGLGIFLVGIIMGLGIFIGVGFLHNGDRVEGKIDNASIRPRPN